MRNQLIRQLNIYLITDTPNPIIDWFNDIWSKIIIMETDVYHRNEGEFIYYIIMDDKKQWIFLQDNKYDRFWCNHETYWSILESRFNLKYTEIQAITKLLVENALKSNIATARVSDLSVIIKVENALKSNIATASKIYSIGVPEVENALQNIIPTKDKGKIENTLNRE